MVAVLSLLHQVPILKILRRSWTDFHYIPSSIPRTSQQSHHESL